ncbi:MAG: A24 family peptidase [Candidatus Promineifilaceae bacterium]|nr:A24 family peptidase [Candidatus Promineifilaceae bacterium]
MIELHFLFGLLGLLTGGLVNALADDLPARVSPQRPHCPRCHHHYRVMNWLAVVRWVRQYRCPQCGLGVRRRPLLVELAMTLLFAILPALFTPLGDMVIYALYVAVLVLIIVIDIEHRLVLHVVTLPTIALALPAAYFLTDHTIRLALAGAAAGFLFFFAAYWLGQRLFGPGALGFGDVTLATTMGAMLGLQRVLFALTLGILLAGLWSIVGLLTRRMNRRSYFAYGPFLAAAGILMLLWGNAILERYVP